MNFDFIYYSSFPIDNDNDNSTATFFFFFFFLLIWKLLSHKFNSKRERETNELDALRRALMHNLSTHKYLDQFNVQGVACEKSARII